MRTGRKRKLTRQDVAWTLEQLSVGVRLDYIARYVFGVSRQSMKSRLESWGVEL